MSATTNAGDVTINFSGGLLSFTASTQVLSASGMSTNLTFENTGGGLVVGTVSADTGNVTLTADDGTIEPESGGSGATINITSTNSSGAITGVTLGAGGAGYPVKGHKPLELAIIGGGGSGGIVAVTTNASGVVTSVASIKVGGSNYANTPAASTIDNMSFVDGATVTLTTTNSMDQIGTPPPVGGTSTPLVVNSSLLYATTNDGFIVLANTTGNMALGALNAGASLIDLTAVGMITDGVGPGTSNSNPPNLTAVDGAVLTTTGSNGTTGLSFSAIGTSGSPIRTQIGFLTATTYDGGVYISDSNGPGLTISSILAQQGGFPPVLNMNNQVVVYNSSNDPNPGTYNVSVTAAGNILFFNAPTVSTTVRAPNAVTITSTGGNIYEGQAGSVNVLAQSVNISTQGTGQFTGGVTFAQSDGGDTITRTDGNMWFDDGFRPGQTITVAGATTPGNNTTYTIENVSGDVLVLTVTNTVTAEPDSNVTIDGTDSVGLAGDPIGLMVPNISASTTNGSIFLTEGIPGTVVNVAAGGANNQASVTAGPACSTFTIDSITADPTSGTVTLQETDGTLASGGMNMNVSAQTVNLTGKTGAGGSGSGAAFTVTAANLSATASNSGAGIFATDTMAATSVSAKTNASDVTINFTGGSLSFTPNNHVLIFSASSTDATFETTSGNLEVGTVSAGTGNVTLIADGGSINAGSPAGSGKYTLNITASQQRASPV